jgi:Bacterial SH3 domain
LSNSRFREVSRGDWRIIHGAVTSLNAVQRLNSFSVKQFYQALYRPDLVKEKLAGDPKGLVKEAAAGLDLQEALAAFVYAQVNAFSKQAFSKRPEPQIKLATGYPLVARTKVLEDENVQIASAEGRTVELVNDSSIVVKPNLGAAVVRGLTSKTKVEVLKEENGWSLTAKNGVPIGYVSSSDLASPEQE